jgi:hypothetical protein
MQMAMPMVALLWFGFFVLGLVRMLWSGIDLDLNHVPPRYTCQLKMFHVEHYMF